MSIRVRYFASLREKMGRTEEDVSSEDVSTVTDLWKAVNEGRPMPDHLLCAVNMEYVDANSTVNDGDEVAFFPPVTGG